MKAALLHDIGKVIYRTGRSGTEFSHDRLGAEWARLSRFPDIVTEAILGHHGRVPDTSDIGLRNVIALVISSDGIAAGMERESVPGEDPGRFDPSALLQNILSSVDIGKGTPVPTYFSPGPGSFPEKKPRAADVTRMWDSLRENMTAETASESILYLLERFLSNIPEHTYRSGEGYPSTSLYHHLKSTAAIALSDCLYIEETAGLDPTKQSLTDYVAKQHPKDERFLLIAADISGIQDFIYGISSKRALRLLRARSFFVELLCETACSLLIDTARLHRCCVIYCSGGGFALLGPNTRTMVSQVNSVASRVNDWLYRNFGASLYVAFAWCPVSASDLKGNLGEAWREVHSKLNEAKNRKWSNRLHEMFEPQLPKPYECECCGTLVDSVETYDDFNVCAFCKKMIEFGKILPELKTLGQTQSDDSLIEIGGVKYGRTGAATRQYVLQADVNPDLRVPTWSLYSGSYVTESEFLELSRRSTGVERLGVLRMDVDNLGTIFSRGLSNPTLARMSDLSARFDFFFKVFIPENIREALKSGLFGKVSRQPALCVVYSGGDDMFLVGAWDQVLDAAFWIQEQFEQYTGSNPNITLSAGMVIADEHIALRTLATLAGKQEHIAKSSGKDRFSVGGICIPWKDRGLLEGLVRALVEVKTDCVKARVSRAFLNNMKALFLGKFEGDRAWRLPRLYYAARRANYPELVREVVPLVHKEDILRCALAVADLSSRGGVKE